MTVHGSDAGVLKRVQQSIWERREKKQKKNTSYLLYRFTTEEEREEDQRTARCHASKFCVVHSTHIKEARVAICVAETRRRCRNRWLSRGRRLAG